MNRDQIAKLMSLQREVWEDTPDAEEAILDTCHAFARQLTLNSDERDAFLGECGYRKVWG